MCILASMAALCTQYTYTKECLTSQVYGFFYALHGTCSKQSIHFIHYKQYTQITHLFIHTLF